MHAPRVQCRYIHGNAITCINRLYLDSVAMVFSAEQRGFTIRGASNTNERSVSDTHNIRKLWEVEVMSALYGKRDELDESQQVGVRCECGRIVRNLDSLRCKDWCDDPNHSPNHTLDSTRQQVEESLYH